MPLEPYKQVVCFRNYFLFRHFPASFHSRLRDQSRSNGLVKQASWPRCQTMPGNRLVSQKVTKRKGKVREVHRRKIFFWLFLKPCPPQTLCIKSTCFPTQEYKDLEKFGSSLLTRSSKLSDMIQGLEGEIEGKSETNPEQKRLDWPESYKRFVKCLSSSFPAIFVSTNSSPGPQKKNKLPSSHLGPGTSKLSRTP